MTQDEGLVEETAKAIFECAYYGRQSNMVIPDKPSWVERGNSTMQDDARHLARAIIPLITRKVEERVLRELYEMPKGATTIEGFLRMYAAAKCNITLDQDKP